MNKSYVIILVLIVSYIGGCFQDGNKFNEEDILKEGIVRVERELTIPEIVGNEENEWEYPIPEDGEIYLNTVVPQVNNYCTLLEDSTKS